MSRRRWGLRSLLAGALLGAVFAPAANADTTIVGVTTLSSTPGFAFAATGLNNPVFQGDASGGYTITSPQTGTILSWSFMSAGIDNGKTFVLRVLHPADNTGTMWTAVATSAPQSVTNAGVGNDVLQGPFATNIAIQAGDRIALQPTDDVNTPTEQGTAGQDGIRFFQAPFADGSTASIDPASTADNAQVVPVQATVQFSSPPPSGPKPKNTHVPEVVGTPKAGQTLLCKNDTWTTFGKAFFTYTWFETELVRKPGGLFVHQTTQVQSGPLRSFVVPDYGAGATIYCSVTATNANGASPAVNSATVTMQATVPVIAPHHPGVGPGTSPTITPSVNVHLQKISVCSHGTWLHHPTKFVYQWYALPSANSSLSAGTFVGTGSTLPITAREEVQWIVCKVIATNQATGQGVALSNRYYVSEPDFGIHVNAMEITQGVQTFELPTRSAKNPSADRVNYGGILIPWAGQPNTCSGTPPGCNNPGVQNRVELAAGHKTVVRVYANSQFPVGAHAMPAILLSAFRGGVRLPPGPIQADQIPPTSALLMGPLGFVGPGQQTSATGAYTFTLPDSWTTGDVTFEAQAGNPNGVLQAVHGGTCVACLERTLILGPEHFNQTTRIHVDQLMFKAGNTLPAPCGGTPGCDPRQEDPAWNTTRAVTAVPIDVYPQGTVLDGSGYINASSHSETSFPDCLGGCTWSVVKDQTDPSHPFYSWQNSHLLGMVTSWGDSNDNLSSHYPFGMVPSNFVQCCYGGGVTSGSTYNASVNLVSSITRVLYGDAQPQSLSIDARPISGIAHELHHGLGRPHEDQVCGGQLKANGFSENWPPANDGLLDGVGLDTSTASPYTLIAPNSIAQPYPVYDFMSYCPLPKNYPAGIGPEQNHWTTVRNWNRDVEFRAPGPTRARDTAGAVRYTTELPAAPAAARSLAVTAVYEVGVQHTEITSINPDTGAPTAFDPKATYSLAGLDSAGRIIARAGALVTVEHIDRSSPEILILGKLAAAGVQGVEVLQNGQPIGRELASPHAPTAAVVGLGSGTRVGGPRGVTIRWRSHDADGGLLQATVLYSPDGGRTWHTVYMGTDQGQAVLPSSFLSASKDALIRVYISDGFNEAIATSPRFVALGAPPVVTITSPRRGARVSVGGALELEATALDDTDARLPSRAFVWRVGRRVIARGSSATTTSLPAGRHTIVLSVRDHTGRTSTASVTVTVTPAPPVLTFLRAPHHVSRKAHSFTVRIAALGPATLTIGRLRALVTRHPRTIRVRIVPGRSALTPVLVLRSGRFATAVPVRVTR